MISPATLISTNAKKSFVEMKKETTIQVEYFINDFTSYTQKFKKKKGVIEGSTLKIYQITQNALFILLLSK